MKRLLVSFAVVGLLAFNASSAIAVPLIGPGLNNGDLDITSVGDQVLATPSFPWSVVSSRTLTGSFGDGASSEGFANVLQAGGSGLFFKPFAGNLTTGNKVTTTLAQKRTGGEAVPGSTYTLTGWAGAGAAYIGLTDPTVLSQFAIDFYSAGDVLLGTGLLDLRTGLSSGLSTTPAQPPLRTPNGNPFEYFNYTLSAAAPAGTAAVTARASMVDAYGNPAGGDQAFVVDSFTLSNTASVPEPTAVVLGLIGIFGLLGSARRR